MRNRLSSTPRRFRRPGVDDYSAGSVTYYAPNHASLTISDHSTISVQDATRLRFSRPITDGNGFQNAAPAARVSFVTTSTRLLLTVGYNGLVTRSESASDVRGFFSVGSVTSGGTEVGTFSWPNLMTDVGTTQAVFALPSGSKTVSIIWPYWIGMDLLQIGLDKGSTFTAATRPATKLALCGDSITQGSRATKITAGFGYQLAQLKNWQVINYANGGAVANAAHATTALTGSGASRVFYLIGYNNFVAQTATATFQTAVEGWITNARTALPSAAIYVASPIYSPNTNTITLAQYRTAVQNAETAVGDANTFYIDGLAMMTNNNNRLYEGASGVHPNDLGASEIATYLSTAIT